LLFINIFTLQVRISPIGPPGAPYMEDNMCKNAVSEVIYEIEFNGTHGIQSVSVRFKVTSISGSSGFSLQQHFTLHFWVSIPVFAGLLSKTMQSWISGDLQELTRMLSQTLPRSGNPGYITGAPLLIANDSAVQHVSFLLSGKANTFFPRLTQMEESNCSYIQLKLYEAFQGMNQAEDLAVIGSAHSAQKEEWVTILIQNCSVQIKNCSSCCMIPVTLDIQILWSKMGLLSNPQAQIVGVRYFYQCQRLKVGISNPVIYGSNEIGFTDYLRPKESNGLDF
ncbi:hypothetical protein CIB84_007430, partial [Bambusicola thoracicus]